MRPPTARPAPNRAQTATPTLTGRLSPADSIASSRLRTPKRKREPEVETDVGAAGEETNINVVVRCRGRSDREVRENSGVVVSTEGTIGKKVELSMGPSALSEKTYHFDKVFSPAADQGTIFNDVVAPILDEVLNGFNCTIFAYGQTGTGKTYTMSGDISDTHPIPDDAGIIPRVLHTLFAKLGEDGAAERNEHGVKCSFIELYNEELRDLLAVDDHVKLKIFDEANKNGRTTTLVQGMEESHIKTAAKGIQLLRTGSHKRQVAATKCNDLSSRSHTVFSITVYTKRTSDGGEDFLSSGKLNLVDLAGSENIQRSGAENKRAVEAGVINKSLLTLGRVINALVDRGSHIPYRESKLTRLLQDSLGGRTKTCIIATLSPAKSNLEETISTLDYAFRAKNIRNKPQINQMMSKKTLLREFTSEIEKLKSELIATRQRNGVYLTTEAWEELNIESESRRILSKEQADKIEVMENNLKNKISELFLLTSNFNSLKKENEQIRVNLESTKDVLEQTEIVLQHTQNSLAEEARLRQAHEETERQLHQVGGDLLSSLETTTNHVDKLHSKLKRRSALQSVNRSRWAASQAQVNDATFTLEERLDSLRSQQENLLAALSGRMQSFVADELRELASSQEFLKEKASAFETSKSEVDAQTSEARDNMNVVLQEIGTLREDVKQKVGAGLHDLSGAGQRISAGISTELSIFHDQLEDSYASLGRELKTHFEDLIKRMNNQQAEVERLRQEITNANRTFVVASQTSQNELKRALEQEKETAAKEREAMLSQITSLVNSSGAAQEARIAGHFENASKRIKTSEDEYCAAQQIYGNGMDSWSENAQALVISSIEARESIKTKLQSDWTSAKQQTVRISDTTDAVHGETVRIVDGQMAQMDYQLAALDEIVSRIRQQNEEHHEAHTSSLGRLASDVQESYRSIGEHLDTSHRRTHTLDADMQDRSGALLDTLPELNTEGGIRAQLRSLREDVWAAQIEEYHITGETPAKIQYTYPTILPRTEEHDVLLARMRGITKPTNDPRPASPSKRSPSKLKGSPRKHHLTGSPSKTTTVYTDTPPVLTLPPAIASAPVSRPESASTLSMPNITTTTTSTNSLRERDVNVSAGATGYTFASSTPATALAARDPSADAREAADCKFLLPSTALAVAPQGLKRHHTAPLAASVQAGDDIVGGGPGMKAPKKKRSARMTVAGAAEALKEKENVNLSASVGPGASAGGRWLRSRGSD